MQDEIGFLFGDACTVMDMGALQVHIPVGVSNKRQLIEVLDSQIGFPDYFGGNWDAFEECIRDLSWLSHVQINLIHEDLPMESDHEAVGIYLSILRDAIAHWKSRPERQLAVVFPKECKDRVRKLISDHQRGENPK